MTDLTKVCPRCHGERRATEFACENEIDGSPCGQSLANVPILNRSVEQATPLNGAAGSDPGTFCASGHSMHEGDLVCTICGTGVAPPGLAPNYEDLVPSEASEPTVIDGWVLDERIEGNSAFECFAARDIATGRAGVLTLYRARAEPDPEVYAVLRRMARDHAPVLYATGRFGERAFDVIERIEGGRLRDYGYEGADDPALFGRIADELGRAIDSLAQQGLRHRSLTPDTILIRTQDPLDLVISGFGSARLSDLDLDVVAPLVLTRYAAPEVIVGAVAAASDWWSLGMILLEHATRGACFEGVNDKAFAINLVTRGMTVPAELDDRVQLLLRGLLARDPQQRWSWAELREWLAGGSPVAPEIRGGDGEESGPAVVLGDSSYRRPDRLAIAAASAEHWDQASDLVLRGSLASWLAERDGSAELLAAVRVVTNDERLDDDTRLSLVLMSLNPDLPLIRRGEIVNPAWLLRHLDVAYEFLLGAGIGHLQRLEREAWLVRLRTRASEVRQRAEILEIRVDEALLRPALLTTSRANLEAERNRLRLVYPDAEQPSLASMLDRARLAEEDLIVLVGAARDQFIPIATVADDAQKMAERVGVDTFNREKALEALSKPRRQIFEAIETLTAEFARCGNTNLDEWADTLRVERRLPLARAVVLLAVPADRWKKPPKQQYVAHILDHFEKRVVASSQRGPLVRFLIGKTTARVDLMEFGSLARPADVLLQHLLERGDTAVQVDPEALRDTTPERFRRLVQHAGTFTRDTGIDGRYLGFPFLVMKTGAGQAAARIAPVLLWPVTIDLLLSRGQLPELAFDRRRNDVRLNPALEGLLGREEVARWRAIQQQLLEQSKLRVTDVVDGFGSLGEVVGRSLMAVPHKDSKVANGTRRIVPAAALFNAQFVGQSIAEDLRHLRGMPLADTGLEVALRLKGAAPAPTLVLEVPERDRYFVADTDPSQTEAVLRARHEPGLLVEGPPGTGKSQTIVNIITDAIGRGESVLVVCQKQAALRVVQKRVAAEGLGDRTFAVLHGQQDRAGLIKELEAHLAKVRRGNGQHATLTQQRQNLAERIDTLEREIDQHHGSLHGVDATVGLSYRQLLGELVELEEGTRQPVELPALRFVLGSLHPSQLEQVAERIAPLARYWLVAHFEGSPLDVLLPFQTDTGLAAAQKEELDSFIAAEAARMSHLATGVAICMDDPTPYQSWLSAYDDKFSLLSPEQRQQCKRLRLRFSSEGDRWIRDLESAQQRLPGVRGVPVDERLRERIIQLDNDELENVRAIGETAAKVPSLLGRLNPLRWRRVRAAMARLTSWDDTLSKVRFAAMRDTAHHEVLLRPLRSSLLAVRGEIGLELLPNERMEIDLVEQQLEETLAQLRWLRTLFEAVNGCPARADINAVIDRASGEAYAEFKERLQRGFQRYELQQRSGDALERLAAWIGEEWVAACRQRVLSDLDTSDATQPLVVAWDNVVPFQYFRGRAMSLDADHLRIFAQMRNREHALAAIPLLELEQEVRRTLRREARLAWKSRFETDHPELLLEWTELDAKIEQLDQAFGKLRNVNKTLLAGAIDAASLGSERDWSPLLRERGRGALKLREIIQRGLDHGLKQLRPIWLMNPESASTFLPCRAGLFDVVIFDEASQLLVEHALPSLFRAKRVVVSGDEKQMPPTSFFSSRFDDEDDQEIEVEPEEGMIEAEAAHWEDGVNQRDIIACPDLLSLARSILPKTVLTIHYRSAYRELIGYSNAAFYGGALNVPARHPEDEIRRIQPLEVVSVNGTYENQTNPAEAERVVDLLARYWVDSEAQRPSIGVVSFNRKQADLIEDKLALRAEQDPAFLAAWLHERDRQQRGEDMGFFVKNVENVQGDERDVIVFSTTFGRDAKGTFRRLFGVLGQQGGERRLNVAVTRARQKIVLLTSMPFNDISDFLVTSRAPTRPRDHLQAYLDYALKVSIGDLAGARRMAERVHARASLAYQSSERREDGFTSSVERFIRERGFEPVPTVEGDAFAIDFAIRDPKTGLFGVAIECDAPGHDLLRRARDREIWRRRVLESGIPRVHRVNSRAWYHSPDQERHRLVTAIEEQLGRHSA